MSLEINFLKPLYGIFVFITFFLFCLRRGGGVASLILTFCRNTSDFKAKSMTNHFLMILVFKGFPHCIAAERREMLRKQGGKCLSPAHGFDSKRDEFLTPPQHAPAQGKFATGESRCRASFLLILFFGPNKEKYIKKSDKNDVSKRIEYDARNNGKTGCQSLNCELNSSSYCFNGLLLFNFFLKQVLSVGNRKNDATSQH